MLFEVAFMLVWVFGIWAVVVCGVLASGRIKGKNWARSPVSRWMILYSCLGLIAGIALSFAYNVAATELVWHFHYDMTLQRLLFAPGLLLAPKGFEGQSLVVPLNLVFMSLFFAGLAWFTLTRKTRRAAALVAQTKM